MELKVRLEILREAKNQEGDLHELKRNIMLEQQKSQFTIDQVKLTVAQAKLKFWTKKSSTMRSELNN